MLPSAHSHIARYLLEQTPSRGSGLSSAPCSPAGARGFLHPWDRGAVQLHAGGRAGVGRAVSLSLKASCLTLPGHSTICAALRAAPSSSASA